MAQERWPRKLMTTANHIIAVPQRHIAGESSRLFRMGTRLVVREAFQGHGELVQGPRERTDAAGLRRSLTEEERW